MAAKKNSETAKKIKKELKEFLDTSIAASKKSLKKAGVALSDLGDEAVIKIDVTKLKLKLEKNYTELGKICADALLEEKKASVSKKTEKVEDILDVVKTLKEKIALKEKELKSHSKNKGTKASPKKAEAAAGATKKKTEKPASRKKS